MTDPIVTAVCVGLLRRSDVEHREVWGDTLDRADIGLSTPTMRLLTWPIT